jgi:hypothetical protein
VGLAGTANARRALSGRSSEAAPSKVWADIVGKLGERRMDSTDWNLWKNFGMEGDSRRDWKAIGLEVRGACYLYTTVHLSTLYLYL